MRAKSGIVIGIVGLTGCGGAATSISGEGTPSATECAVAAGAAGAAPTNLGCTGLFTDATNTALASGVFEFAPAEALWADGATKRRFVRLPLNTAIDTSNMDAWTFPTGTQFWKEFSVGSHKVETRYLQKQADGTWIRTTYAWSDDESTATEVTTGVSNVRGTGYDIPAQTECSECHAGATDGVLGFEAISLSAPGATGLTMEELTRLGLLSAPPASPPVIPGTPLDAAALGWLHANCGNACHNATPNAMASWTGLYLRLTIATLGSVQSTDTYTTAVGVPSGFQPTPGAGLLRIAPGDSAHSAIPFRAGSRVSTGAQPGWQMPPIASNFPDVADVDMVNAWIDSL